ncbi:hypothetical protein ACFWN1_20120 [Streptomyces sp. NPDC058459]|uniref:hypothetical protein n=1 Tax=Streptomyces sp. NPDC058459 TaxID=3346508 RepID=UPI00364D1605
MSVGGAGIPRLQELSYIETAALAVARGDSFGQIRVAMVEQAERIARKGDNDGSFNGAKWAALRADHRRYVHNTVDVLKELMRLGWVERHVLPSSPRSAYAHAQVVFELTPQGRAWTDLVAHDTRVGYNVLFGELLNKHPQFEGFLRVVGARPDSDSDQLSIPLLRWDGTSRRNGQEFRRAFIAHLVDCLRQGGLGWSAEPTAAAAAIDEYVSTAVQRAENRISRWKAHHQADREKALQSAGPQTGSTAKAPPPLTRRRIVSFCEEAAVRLAFTAAGCPMDYISHELLRHWSSFMGLTNYSYYAPGPPALRLWATGTVAGKGADATFRRSVGPAVCRSVLAALPRICHEETMRMATPTDYLAIWRIRAAVCWQLRISDAEFDAALLAAHRGRVEGLPYQIHMDGASGTRTPGSTGPLVSPTLSGPRVFHIMRLEEADAGVAPL